MFPPNALGTCALTAILSTACSPPSVSSARNDQPSADGTDAGASHDGPGRAGLPDVPFSFTVPDAQPASAPDPDAACAAETVKADRTPLDLYLLIDVSGSMGGAIAGNPAVSKWKVEHDALVAFVNDPRSSGLNVGLGFFPAALLCDTDADCVAAAGITRAGACGRLPAGVCVTAFGGPVDPPMPCIPGQLLCRLGLTCATNICSHSHVPCTTTSGQTCRDAADVCQLPPKVCLGTPAPSDAAHCPTMAYETPDVEITAIPTGSPPLVDKLDGVRPGGGTPMAAAVMGALKHLGRYLTAHPGHRGVLVLVTDGGPDGDCGGEVGVTAPVAAAKNQTPSIPTYTIGVFGSDDPQASRFLAQTATAGGTGAPFVLMPNADLATSFLTTLDKIRSTSLPCEYVIPRPQTGTLDYDKVNVHYAGATGEDIPFVRNAAGCDPTRGGWYYDVDPKTGGTPTRIEICGGTCDRFKMATAGEVQIRLGCQTLTIQ